MGPCDHKSNVLTITPQATIVPPTELNWADLIVDSSEAGRAGRDVDEHNDVQSPACEAAAVVAGAVCQWLTS